METYKNSYTAQEDRLLWELHEIRHTLHTRRQHCTIEDINRAALKKYAMWQQERERRQRETRHEDMKMMKRQRDEETKTGKDKKLSTEKNNTEHEETRSNRKIIRDNSPS